MPPELAARPLTTKPMQQFLFLDDLFSEIFPKTWVRLTPEQKERMLHAEDELCEE